MVINTLNFLNKNQFRNYPIKAGSVLRAIDGKMITTELLVGCSVSTTADNLGLFIKQITADGNNISVVLGARLINGDFKTLGIFEGDVLSNFTSLKLSPFVPFVSGNLIIGSVDGLRALNGVYTFHEEDLPLEESTIFYYTPPQVTSIVNDGIHLRGKVNFGVLNNLVKSREGNNIRFGVIDSASLASLVDLDSAFNNCRTPVIRYVDGAVPFYDISENYEELQGNLFMVGVSPIIFYGEQGENTVDAQNLPVYNGGISTGTISLSGSPLTLDTLCTAKNAALPPINPNYFHNLPNQVDSNPSFIGKQNYYSKSAYVPVNFIGTTLPEFVWWPQFLSGISPVRPIATGSGVEATIGSAPDTANGKSVIAVTLINSGPASLNVTITKDDNPIAGYTNILITPNQSVTVRGQTATQIATGDLFKVYFNSATGGNSFLQPYVLYR